MYAGLNDALTDGGSSDTFKIGSNVGSLKISGFGSDTTGIVDLLNGVGGYTTAAAAFHALASDGAGGSLLSLGTDGSIDLLGVAPTSLQGDEFQDRVSPRGKALENDAGRAQRPAHEERRTDRAEQRGENARQGSASCRRGASAPGLARRGDDLRAESGPDRARCLSMVHAEQPSWPVASTSASETPRPLHEQLSC